LEELGIRDLTPKQLEELCNLAEATARKHVLSTLSPRKISSLNVAVDADGMRPLTVDVEVEVVLSPSMTRFNPKNLAKEAVESAFAAIENYLRHLSCVSPK
jgi:hypothetical protein